jgi:gas vesicle protein GvpA/GvpJ/GvpM family
VVSRAVAAPPAGDIALIDLLDRLLQGGIVIQGDVTLAAAEIDLVKLDLRILVAAIDTVAGR